MRKIVTIKDCMKTFEGDGIPVTRAFPVPEMRENDPFLLFDLPLIDKKTQSIVEKYIHESLAVLTNDVIRQEILKMFNMPFPLNCFYRSQVKFKWVEILKEHFIKTNYELGLKKCLNKIDSIIN